MEGDAGSGQLNPTPPVTSESSDHDTHGEAESSSAVDALVPGASTADEGHRDTVLVGRPWLKRACGALIVVSVILTIGGALALWGHYRNAVRDRNEVAAVAAAKECVSATQAPDAKAMAASATKIMECATGDFATQAKIYSGVLVDAYQAANAQVQVADLRAAVERDNSDGTIDVLVAVRTKLTNAEQDAQQQSYRLRVKMAKDGGSYKVSRMDQVGQ